ncbi:serine hydrolase domain-containing protein [Angustibacter sp. McL0619]|uniref:serine hydrolase domain-containing protein n=1 Tax=Angustibacter sp. McL0619 TaxID=3415676 RepID=UPI003CE6BD12
MTNLQQAVRDLSAREGFSGVVRVDRGGDVELADAYGFADRALQLDNTVDTRFAIASGVKGMTAMVVVSLIDQGHLELTTPARAILGDDLPLIDDAVTVEQLLSHRSGIGDYVDEEGGFDVEDYVLPVPVHTLATTTQYLTVLGGHPQKFPPGERYAYCNSGFVVLALIAERVAGSPFHELVQDRVCAPAGMTHTAFLRSDELPAGVARGYLRADGLRSNVLHLPVRGSGDGGIYTTVADVHAMWTALFAGRIVPERWRAELHRARSDVPEEGQRYGLGFWLHESRDVAALEGFDAGVSFRSVHDPSSAVTRTVISNNPKGAWPIARLLEELLDA